MINLSENGNPDRFASIHFIGVSLPNGRHMLTRSGVARVGFNGITTQDWNRDELHIGLDLRAAIRRVQPRPPRDGFEWALRFEQWAPIAGLNSIFNQNSSNNSGHAVDTFRIPSSLLSTPRRFVTLICDLAVRDSDAVLIRVGYHLTVVGTLEEVDVSVD